ncbi:MAG: CopG family transcriptional regulator [Methanomassiliicoccaceae archaeon]|nr:CopG family transcriptional regulator [Methanomassiliicoccaceae archaeon]
MDTTEKIIVRLTPDMIIALQALVDRGDYDSLSESVSDAISKMIESKFTPKEVAKLVKEHSKEKPLKMESLLSDGEPESMDDAVRKAVREYVRTRL